MNAASTSYTQAGKTILYSDVAIGVVGCNDSHMLCECLQTIYETAKDLPIVTVYYDDASYQNNVDIAAQAGAHIIEAPCNRGAAYGRNQIWKHCRRIGKKYCATVDMDILVQPGWLQAMLGVMLSRDNAGAVGMPMCNNQGGHFPVRHDGCVAEMASMIGLYNIQAFDDFLGPDRVWGMDERLELLAHDSEFFQRMKRCSRWRLYLTDKDYAVHKNGHHSTRSSSPTLASSVCARRQRDSVVWGELSGSRGWEEGKEKV